MIFCICQFSHICTRSIPPLLSLICLLGLTHYFCSLSPAEEFYSWLNKQVAYQTSVYSIKLLKMVVGRRNAGAAGRGRGVEPVTPSPSVRSRTQTGEVSEARRAELLQAASELQPSPSSSSSGSSSSSPESRPTTPVETEGATAVPPD